VSRRTRCLPDNLLQAYLQRTLSNAAASRVETHLALCAGCRHVSAAASEALALGVSADELKARIATAEAFVAELEGLPTAHGVHRAIAMSEAGADRFVAGRLLERSRDEFERDPRKSMLMARAAIWVAERAASADLQFEGWRDCASLCIRLGHLGDAWDALDRAAAFVQRTTEPLYSTALLLYAKAYVGSQPDVWRLEEALSWTDEAARIFERTDAQRLRATAEMRAFIHNVRGEHAAAVEICRSLWEQHQDVGLALNFANYLVDHGEPEGAHTLLDWSVSKFSLEDIVTVGKHREIRGMAYSAQHQWDAAAAAFAQAVRAVQSVGMDDTAIRVELSRVRAVVSAAPDSATVIDKAIADMRRLAQTSAELDRREPTRRRRLTAEAFQYLRELGEAKALTLDSLRHVEGYLCEITRGPARPFVRPLPPRIM
jgi:tetratricopeptide (TPR) repeat protein